jgi:hypothetical protein
MVLRCVHLYDEKARRAVEVLNGRPQNRKKPVAGAVQIAAKSIPKKSE